MVSILLIMDTGNTKYPKNEEKGIVGTQSPLLKPLFGE